VTAALLLALAAAFWRPWRQPAELVFLDVGAGDAAFLRTTGGSTVLIDGGDRIDAAGAERVVTPFLRSNRVARLDYVVATHSDADHLTGVQAVVEEFRVETVLLPLRQAPDEAEKGFLALCERRKVPVRRLCRGDTVALAGGKLTALHPPPDWSASASPNEGSLALRLEWAGPTVLFAGDIEAEAETALVRTPCAADILKVPHHGSRTSSTEPFLAAVGPADAVVSTGLLRGRELARPDVLARYERRGIRVWRTDRLGGIRVTPREGGYRIESARRQRGYPVPEPPGAAPSDAY
jgi:competence protein ComEC